MSTARSSSLAVLRQKNDIQHRRIDTLQQRCTVLEQRESLNLSAFEEQVWSRVLALQRESAELELIASQWRARCAEKELELADARSSTEELQTKIDWMDALFAEEQRKWIGALEEMERAAPSGDSEDGQQRNDSSLLRASREETEEAEREANSLREQVERLTRELHAVQRELEEARAMGSDPSATGAGKRRAARSGKSARHEVEENARDNWTPASSPAASAPAVERDPTSLAPSSTDEVVVVKRTRKRRISFADQVVASPPSTAAAAATASERALDDSPRECRGAEEVNARDGARGSVDDHEDDGVKADACDAAPHAGWRAAQVNAQQQQPSSPSPPSRRTTSAAARGKQRQTSHSGGDHGADGGSGGGDGGERAAADAAARPAAAAPAAGVAKCTSAAAAVGKKKLFSFATSSRLMVPKLKAPPARMQR